MLSDRRIRRDYDRVRTSSTAAVVAQPAPIVRAEPAPRRGWSRRRAWTALIGGIIVAILGIGATFVTWYLRDRDANERARFIGVTAQRLSNGDITFDTNDGRHIVVARAPPARRGSGRGPTVDVRYDPANPQHVVLDASTFGRDITLAIVALKLLIGGVVFAVLGARRLRRLRATAVRSP